MIGRRQSVIPLLLFVTLGTVCRRVDLAGDHHQRVHLLRHDRDRPDQLHHGGGWRNGWELGVERRGRGEEREKRRAFMQKSDGKVQMCGLQQQKGEATGWTL